MNRAKIQFICAGNTFRSRMAEAYMKKLAEAKGVDIEVSSSGVRAYKDQNGPVAWVTVKILKSNKLLPYMSRDWQQTEEQGLRDADINVFIGKDNYEYCLNNISKDVGKTVVWNIDDISKELDTDENMNYVLAQGREIFEEIKQKSEELGGKLKLL